MIVKNLSVGINASDVNFTAGAYSPGGIEPPFTVGFEAVGTVVAAGEKAMAKEGDHVVYMENGAFCEYQTVRKVFPVPTPNPEYIPLLVSGLTAALSLKLNGVDIFNESNSKPQKVGLVTAAAGGTGQFAVQLMKNAGIEKVIATCSTDEKVEFLSSIGATHPINLSNEKLGVALPNIAPSGVNVAYESVGGKVLDSTINNLATGGKCINIGFITHYISGDMARGVSPGAATIPMKLLMKSASMNGFFLFHYPTMMPSAFQNLRELLDAGKIISKIDNGPDGGFHGIEAIPDGVDYLYSKKSIGKIIVNL